MSAPVTDRTGRRPPLARTQEPHFEHRSGALKETCRGDSLDSIVFALESSAMTRHCA